MCLALPYRVTTIKRNNIFINKTGREKKVKGSLIKVKVGDWVILQNNVITGKISQKTAAEIINLTKSNL